MAGDDARFDYEPNNVDPVSGLRLDGPTQLTKIDTSALVGNIVGDDELHGGDDDDLLIGGFGVDKIWGDAGNDIALGDAAVVLFTNGVMTRIDTVDRGDVRNGADIIRGGDGDDVLAGGDKSDRIDGGAQDDLIFGDNVMLVLNAGFGDAVNPRYRLVGALGTLYDANGDAIVGTVAQPRPGGNPAWADWTITLDPSLDPSHFGDDYIAGGANADTIFGQRGNDIIQGDGSIDLPADVSATRNASGQLVVVASVESATDGDDYIEGNAGTDTIFGNLGQDDIVGGSSSAFVWSLPLGQRDDGSDLIFGGAGTELLRNETGNTVDEGDTSHSRDSDMILGDNGNIYRMVRAGGGYVTFNYDNYGGERIKVRAADLVDYTEGGIDFNAAASADLGAGDELHGESGDDFLYGMTGHDVMFGEGQDDDIIGGYGTRLDLRWHRRRRSDRR